MMEPMMEPTPAARPDVENFIRELAELCARYDAGSQTPPFLRTENTLLSGLMRFDVPEMSGSAFARGCR